MGTVFAWTLLVKEGDVIGKTARKVIP